MESAVRFVIMGGLAVGTLYLLVWWHNRKQRVRLSIDERFVAVPQKPFLPAIIGVGVSLVVGVMLAMVSFSKPMRAAHKKALSRTPEHFTPVFTDAGIEQLENRMKVIIFEDPNYINPLTLEKCPDNEVTYISRRGQVRCLTQDDARRDYAKLRRDFLSSPEFPAMRPKPMMQMVAPIVGENSPPPTQRPWKDRFAEVIYFLALVLGVLGKYYWDYSEQKQSGKDVPFQPNYIVLSLIVALLVYFSVQQGIEGEGGNLTTRGFLFAFMNGFTWQSLIRPGGIIRPPNGGKKEANGAATSSQ